MVDEIVDLTEAVMPGEKGSVTPEAQALHDETKTWRDQAETFSAATQTLQDSAVSALIDSPASKTRIGVMRVRTLPGSIAVFIGDSITQGYRASDTAHRWTSLLCTRYGWDEHNYGIGGSGWLNHGPNGGARFDEQAAAAAADDSYDHTLVGNVFVFGGANDSGDVDTAKQVIDICLTILRQAFPNARIITGFSQQGGGNPGYAPQLKMSLYFGISSYLVRQGVICLADSWRWIITDSYFWSDDGIHPNDFGYSQIAGFMIGIIDGTWSGRYINRPVSYDMTYPESVDTHSIGLHLDEFSARFYGNLTYTIPAGHNSVGKTTGTFDLFYLPDFINSSTLLLSDRGLASVNTVIQGIEAWWELTRIDQKIAYRLHVYTLNASKYQMNAGDKVQAFINFDMPLDGLSG